MSPDERMARIALACVIEPGTAGVAEAVEELGAQAVLRQAARAGVARPDGVAGRLAVEEVPAMLDRMAREGVRVLVAGDLEYPSQLTDLAEPPLALWVRGPLDLRTTALRSAAVVGARACTAYGERVTAGFAAGLAEQGWAVVSGGAFGVDAAAHRAALGVGGPTVAVLACGVDMAYPRAHDALLCRIADTGLLVSELPPGSPALRHRFLARNRLIAALTRGTVVVEAALRSGAIATANRAHEIGRVVMAVPGPVTSMASSGTNRMLHEQTARAVCDVEQVVALLAGPGAVQLGLDEEPPAAGGAARQGGDPARQAGDPARQGRDPARQAGDPGRPGGDPIPAAATRAQGRGEGSPVTAADTPGPVADPDPGTHGHFAAGAAPTSPASRTPTLAGLPEGAVRVFAEVPGRNPRGTAAIAARAGLTPAQCLAHLGVLELAGLVVRSRAGWRRTG